MKPSTRLSISNAYFTPLLMSLNSINLALSFSLTVLGGAVPPRGFKLQSESHWNIM